MGIYKNRMMLTLLFALLLYGCSSSDADQDIFRYNHSYIGDNSAVSNIIQHLPRHEHFKELALATREEPYGMNITYEALPVNMTEEERRETVLYNATFLIVLVQNAEWVSFQFDDKYYHVTKEQLQAWYDMDLYSFTDEEQLRNYVHSQLEDQSKVNLFFDSGQ